MSQNLCCRLTNFPLPVVNCDIAIFDNYMLPDISPLIVHINYLTFCIYCTRIICLHIMLYYGSTTL